MHQAIAASSGDHQSQLGKCIHPHRILGNASATPESAKATQIATSRATIDIANNAETLVSFSLCPFSLCPFCLCLRANLFHSPGFEVLVVRKGIDANPAFVVNVELAIEHRMNRADIA